MSDSTEQPGRVIHPRFILYKLLDAVHACVYMYMCVGCYLQRK